MRKRNNLNFWYESYIFYILIQKQYDINGMFLDNPRNFYYLHYILMQKQNDISGRLLGNQYQFLVLSRSVHLCHTASASVYNVDNRNPWDSLEGFHLCHTASVSVYNVCNINPYDYLPKLLTNSITY
jgi:hypothetical protein